MVPTNIDLPFHHEPARQVPVVAQCDVCVCGGGPAGVAAAIAAARAGTRTVLLEVQGCLGGVWTSGLLSYIIDAGQKPGIMAEVLRRLGAQGWQRGGTNYDAEGMKLLLETMCREAGVQVRLHTRVVAAARDEHNRLAVAITESKSGREAWAAQVFVDATGDGDLAAQAGCGFDAGHPENGQTQPMSLMCLLCGLDSLELDAAGLARREGDTAYNKAVKVRMREVMSAAGVEVSYAMPTLFQIHDDLYALMATHQYGASALDANQLTAATLEARGEVHALMGALRRGGGVWRRARIVATANHIGVREGRRIQGRYQITKHDLERGARFEDAVCRVTFGVDIHPPTPSRDVGYSSDGVKARPYDIPLRALIARDCDGLLLAGRCISGDFWAHASYRVTGNAVAMGEAVGRVAARAVKENCLPHEIGRFISLDEVRVGTTPEIYDPIAPAGKKTLVAVSN